MITETALPQDYVAFKLDIDTPDVEIPIALGMHTHMHPINSNCQHNIIKLAFNTPYQHN